MAVLSLTWKSPYVDKTVFILRRGPVCYNRWLIFNIELLHAVAAFTNMV